jgi:hypothetical protein
MTDYLNISETEPLLEILAMNGGRCFFMNLAMAGSALTKIRASLRPEISRSEYKSRDLCRRESGRSILRYLIR